jgi:hypothetical protein
MFAGMIAATLILISAGCGGNSGSTTINNPPPQNGTVNLILSDASTEDWATIGVKVLNVSLIPQGGGSPVTVYTATNPPQTINLVQLDQLGEILGNATIKVGTYTAAVVTVAANPGDVMLTVSANPEQGFAGTAGATISSSQIQIQNTSGSTGNLTTSVNVNFDTPLTVIANQSNALDLEFDLSHPVFIVDHVPAGGGAAFWAVTFKGPIRRHHIGDLRALVLRHQYGTVTGVSADNTSFTMTKDYPVYPPTNPETDIPSTLSLQILADATNGTIFYDLDAKTRNIIKDFSAQAPTLDGRYVRVAARYQSDGSLVAVRIWASDSFNSVWVSPEGHVLHVNTTTDVITVQNEAGIGIPVTVDANTEFFFRTPQNALADATPIGTGPSFLTEGNLARGFKVHVSVVDPLATPLVAQTVDIEVAPYSGWISNTNTLDFTYTRNFATASDDYIKTLTYISDNTPNGTDGSGNPVDGFKWWYFTFPTLATTGTNAIPSFITATTGSVNFGGSLSSMTAWGVSYATWNDPASANNWSARWAVLEPIPVPLGTVETPWAAGTNGGSFGMMVLDGTNIVPVDLSTVSGSATLVYQIDKDKTSGVITVSAVDITTTNGLNALIAALVKGTPVKVYGVPLTSGAIGGYVLFYYTGTLPSAAS